MNSETANPHIGLEAHFQASEAKHILGWVRLCFLVFAISFFVEPFIVDRELLSSALVMRFLSALGAYVIYRHHLAHPVKPESANVTGELLVLYVLAVIVLDFVLLSDQYFNLYVQLLLITTGTITLSLRVAGRTSTMILVAWYAAHAMVGEIIPADEFFLTLAALAVGSHSLYQRRRIAVDEWLSIQQEMGLRRELAQALKAAQEAKTYLNAEVSQSSSEVSQAIEGIIVNREQRAKLHKRLLHSNRLSALGRMAAGLAHRLNNRLLVIMGTVGCMESGKLEPHEQAMVAEVKAATERGAKLAEQLLPLTGKQHINPENVEVDQLLYQFSPLLKKTKAPFEILNSVKSAYIHVDRDAWFQILFNLVKNADQVSPDGAKIQLVVSEEDSEIVFSVEDGGPGVPKRYREKIFEPFFTTRSDTGGTGLGLSIVLGLVEQMHGRLAVSTSPLGGAKFSVSFDKVSSPPQVEKATVTPTQLCSLVGLSVLLVEDDPSVLRTLERHLLVMGLQVTTAQNGQEGLEKFQAAPADVVLTDVVMPTMDGPTMVRELWRSHPQVKVLFTSGYSDARLKEQGLGHQEIEFLAKPYTREALAESLQKVLASH